MNEPSEELKAIIERGTAARGWIVNSYAQFENLLSDLVMRARELPEYENFEVPYRTDKRIASVRKLLAGHGPLAQFKGDIGGLLERFEGFEDSRLLLVHGFTKVLVSPRGEVGFCFEVYRRGKGGKTEVRRKIYRPHELEAEHQTFVTFATEAFERFRAIHRQMGWIG